MASQSLLHLQLPVLCFEEDQCVSVSLGLFPFFGSPWFSFLNSHSCSCMSQAEQAFLLRKQHLETSGDDTFVPSITSGTTVCQWPFLFSQACPGPEPEPGAWLWEGSGRHREQLDRARSVTSSFWLQVLSMSKDRVSLFQELRTWQTR